jgi:septum formation protein
MQRSIILASNSPRRKDLLEQIGLTFSIAPTNIDEQVLPNEVPYDHALRLAFEKAQKAAQEHDGIVIAADTIVVLNGKIMGKPSDGQHAGCMLKQLSGKEHSVITGLAVMDSRTGRIMTGSSNTRVWFRHLTAEEIAAYIITGEPLDKAGAYGIQGKGAIFVEKIDGCYFNVVGLPLSLLYKLLISIGVRMLES